MKQANCPLPILSILRSQTLRYILILFLFGFVLWSRMNHLIGEYYSRHFYPFISDTLSHLANVSDYSLEEGIICFFIFLLLHSLCACRRHKWKRQLLKCVEILLWIAIWFYWGWGINYFRLSFYERMNIEPVSYQDTVFHSFLKEYTLALNQNYTPLTDQIKVEYWETEIKNIYHAVPTEAGLCHPQKHFTPKKLVFNTLYSKVGVLGFMGPFFCEMQLNEELLPQQYPFTYAHELAHLLGVSSEAEANYWAYKVCTASTNSTVRFCGYLGILPYVMNQAYRCLDATQYRTWLTSIRPEILKLAEQEHYYWKEKYSSWIGNIQNAMYEAFLKGNQINNGQKNYGQVLSLIISEREQQTFNLTNLNSTK